MAVINGIKEKVHAPLYDSIRVEPEKQLRGVESSSILKFFVNVQGKTKLETNLQSASLLPHYNTFEARAMRVVISDLPPEFPEDPSTPELEELEVTDDEGNPINREGQVAPDPAPAEFNGVTATAKLPLNRLVDLLQEARASDDGFAALSVDDEDLVLDLSDTGGDLDDAARTTVEDAGGVIRFSRSELLGHIDEIKENQRPLKEQLDQNNGSGTLIGKFVYNTVTTFFVGEKIMIQTPTWMFPAGAGPYSEAARVTTHGEPSPLATFRFAEPIFIDKQQNFRVEIEVPDSDVLKELQRIYGPLFIWVVLDGYMERDVQ